MPSHYRIYLNNEHTNAHTDYDEVYTLWMSCTGMALNNIDDSREGIEKFLARNLETCFVAETEKKISGIILAGNDERRQYDRSARCGNLPRFTKADIRVIVCV